MKRRKTLRGLGVDVTLVEAMNQLMAPFDYDIAAFIHAEVRRKGVNLVLGRKLQGFKPDGESLEVSIEGRLGHKSRHGYFSDGSFACIPPLQRTRGSSLESREALS